MSYCDAMGMANAARPDPFPTDYLASFPAHIRHAFLRWGRARRAHRMYLRRGWNTSAVRAELDRARAEALRLMDEWEHQEMNPPLF